MRSQDERSAPRDTSGTRFEKSVHHRDQVYIPSRSDKEPGHARRPAGKSNNSSTGRSSSSKMVAAAHAHDQTHSPKQSTASTPKQLSVKARQASIPSDTSQPQPQIKQRKSSATPSEQLLNATCTSNSELTDSFSIPFFLSLALIKEAPHSIPPVTIRIDDEGSLRVFLDTYVYRCFFVV